MIIDFNFGRGSWIGWLKSIIDWQIFVDFLGIIMLPNIKLIIGLFLWAHNFEFSQTWRKGHESNRKLSWNFPSFQMKLLELSRVEYQISGLFSVEIFKIFLSNNNKCSRAMSCMRFTLPRFSNYFEYQVSASSKF